MARPKPPVRSNFASIYLPSEWVSISNLKVAAARLRIHSKAKIQSLTRSLEKFGQIEPIVINGRGVVIHGLARLQAAKEMGWAKIAAVRVEHLTDDDLRVYAIAANKLVLDADWDFPALRQELEAIEAGAPTLDLSLSGFSIPEIDTLRGAYEASTLNDLVDDVPERKSSAEPVTQVGDIWSLGRHKLICGSALDQGALARLMDEDEASLIFTDPPYNVPIDGHVSGMGKVRHREFAMASGEMSEDEFIRFLITSLGLAVRHLRDGGLAYVCMDHAHIGELIAAGTAVFDERKAICVWDKGAGGMGSLYRNAHELVAVFKKGKARHINNVKLGKHGRNRTTMWRYPGVAQSGKGKAKALSLHPTVKPVALVADVLLDASPRGGVVLDPFAGSGTTLIAAEIKGRSARLVELDPTYVDTIIERFRTLTGTDAVLEAGGHSFAAVREKRRDTPRQPHHFEDGAQNEEGKEEANR